MLHTADAERGNRHNTDEHRQHSDGSTREGPRHAPDREAALISVVP